MPKKAAFFVSRTTENSKSLYLLIPADKAKEFGIEPDKQYAVKMAEVNAEVLD